MIVLISGSFSMVPFWVWSPKKPNPKWETKSVWKWGFPSCSEKHLHWFKRRNAASASKETFYFLHSCYNFSNSCVKMITAPDDFSNCHFTCVLHHSSNRCPSEQFLDLSSELTFLTNLNLFQTLLTYLVTLVVFSLFNCYVNLQAQ